MINFFEELFFRGIILLILYRYGFMWAIIVIPIQAFLWGLGHFAESEYAYAINKSDIVFRLIFNPIKGILLGLITLFSGSIIIPYLLHILSNEAIDCVEIWYARKIYICPFSKKNNCTNG